MSDENTRRKPQVGFEQFLAGRQEILDAFDVARAHARAHEDTTAGRRHGLLPRALLRARPRRLLHPDLARALHLREHPRGPRRRLLRHARAPRLGGQAASRERARLEHALPTTQQRAIDARRGGAAFASRKIAPLPAVVATCSTASTSSAGCSRCSSSRSTRRPSSSCWRGASRSRTTGRRCRSA